MSKKYSVALVVILLLSSSVYSSSQSANSSNRSSKRVLTNFDREEALLAQEDVRSQMLRFYDLKKKQAILEKNFQELKCSISLFAQHVRLLDAQRSGVPFDINSIPGLNDYFYRIQKLQQENSMLKYANLEQKRALEGSRLEASALRTVSRGSNATPDDTFFAELILTPRVSANNSPKIPSPK